MDVADALPKSSIRPWIRSDVKRWLKDVGLGDRSVLKCVINLQSKYYRLSKFLTSMSCDLSMISRGHYKPFTSHPRVGVVVA